MQDECSDESSILVLEVVPLTRWEFFHSEEHLIPLLFRLYNNLLQSPR